MSRSTSDRVDPAQDYRIEPVRTEGDLRAALAIREIVFIEEQQIPADLEQDEEDGKAYHLLVLDGGHAIATGRLVAMPDGWGRVGRMAVLSAYRGRGIGKRLLEALEAEAARRGEIGIFLHSQVTVRGFYAKLGYVEEGERFLEAGVEHIAVRKQFPPG